MYVPPVENVFISFHAPLTKISDSQKSSITVNSTAILKLAILTACK